MAERHYPQFEKVEQMPSGKVREFFALSAEEEQALKQRIEAGGGV